MDQKQAYEHVVAYYEQGKKLDDSTFFGFMCESQYLFWARWQYWESQELLQKAYELNPNDAELNEFIAEIYTTLGDFEKAWKYADFDLKI